MKKKQKWLRDAQNAQQCCAALFGLCLFICVCVCVRAQKGARPHSSPSMPERPTGNATEEITKKNEKKKLHPVAMAGFLSVVPDGAVFLPGAMTDGNRKRAMPSSHASRFMASQRHGLTSHLAPI